MRKDEDSNKAHSADHVEHEAQPLEEAKANKKRFVEPEISVPVDVFNATTFFLFASTEAEGEF
jgi:hypothetical protein